MCETAESSLSVVGTASLARIENRSLFGIDFTWTTQGLSAERDSTPGKFSEWLNSTFPTGRITLKPSAVTILPKLPESLVLM